MALPPKGDASRPVYLGARSALILGVLCLLLGGMGLLLDFRGLRRGVSIELLLTAMPLNMGPSSALVLRWLIFVLNFRELRGGGFPIPLLLAALPYLAVGTMYIVVSVFMKKYRPWAFVVGLTLAGLTVLWLLNLIVRYLRGRSISVTELILALALVAIVQMIFHFIKGLRYVSKHAGTRPGCTSLMHQPVVAIEPREGSSV